MEQNENTLSVLKIAPGQHPQQVEIDNNLKALQEAVGGTIAAVYPFADPVAIICNDDGKLMGLPLNRALRDTRSWKRNWTKRSSAPPPTIPATTSTSTTSTPLNTTRGS